VRNGLRAAATLGAVLFGVVSLQGASKAADRGAAMSEAPGNDALAAAIADALSCPTPKKARLRDLVEARAVVEAMAGRGRRARAYQCHGCRCWHVTTKRSPRLMEVGHPSTGPTV
jgi:hypothetical protein